MRSVGQILEQFRQDRERNPSAISSSKVFLLRALRLRSGTRHSLLRKYCREKDQHAPSLELRLFGSRLKQNGLAQGEESPCQTNGFKSRLLTSGGGRPRLQTRKAESAASLMKGSCFKPGSKGRMQSLEKGEMGLLELTSLKAQRKMTLPGRLRQQLRVRTRSQPRGTSCLLV